ncbi:MAG: glycogen/starch/alpha-glucan phosphorylase [Desulfobacterales bacterium]
MKGRGRKGLTKTVADPSDPRRGNSIDAIRKSILDHIHFSQARLPVMATRNDWYVALAYTVRDRMFDHWINVVREIENPDRKVVGYLSAEFLIGPHLGNALINLGIYENAREAVSQLGLNMEDLLDHEGEPGLGNGGLGRLAACYMDSLAALGVPAIGYGIRYAFGIFDQDIQGGWQVEKTDKWLRLGNPWEVHRPEMSCTVNFGGHTEAFHDENGRYRVRWIPNRVVRGVPYDTPVPSYRRDFIDLLRLWKSEAVESFDFQAFNIGNYYKAVDEKVVSETISKVLYPNDEPEIGKTLRLAQQYFFVSCSLQDMIRIHQTRGKRLETFHESFAIQLNDTHPSIAVAELMRLLVDVHDMDWDTAWGITRNALAYTNHTLLSEALETWPLAFFRHLLPRHMEIIFEINHRFLEEVRRRFPGNDALAGRVSI